MTRITFATTWKDPDTGATYKGGETAEINPATARVLLARGRARHALAADHDAVPVSTQTEETAPAALAEPEPTAEAEPAGSAKTATASRRGKTKEATPDE